jgi:hypothetical protein
MNNSIIRINPITGKLYTRKNGSAKLFATRNADIYKNKPANITGISQNFLPGRKSLKNSRKQSKVTIKKRNDSAY